MKKKNQNSSSIGEMMLAKTVLEEKNELLEDRDRQVRELAGRVRELTAQAGELRGELASVCSQHADVRQAAHLEGVREVVEEVVGVLADWGKEEPKLASRLFHLLREKHGLEVIDRIQGRIDPRIHRVLEVSRESESGTEVLAKGYRLGEWVLRPALVKVILAAESPSSA